MVNIFILIFLPVPPYQWLMEDDLDKRLAKHTNKSTLVAKGTDTQLGYSCVLAPLATNVDLWNPVRFHQVVRFNMP